jgi:hypothetical protein
VEKAASGGLFSEGERGELSRERLEMSHEMGEIACFRQSSWKSAKSVRTVSTINAVLHMILVIVLTASTLLSAPVGQAPFAFEPSLAKRVAYSEIVCSIGGAERNEYVAEAEVHRVFKGTMASRFIQFRYFGFGRPDNDYFGPPLASFETGATYILPER